MNKYFPNLAKDIHHFNLSRKPFFNLTYHFSLDKDKVIFVDWGFLEGNKKDYFPITLQQYAITNYNLFYDTKKASYKRIFLNNAKKLLSLLQINGDIAYWPITRKMKIAGYKFKKPYYWVSSIAQGYGLSVFIRAHELSKNKQYLDAAEKIVNSFEWNIKEGGFLDVDEYNNYWFEEFPAEKRAHVLNGFIYSLLGLYEYYSYTKYKKAKDLFDSGIRTLEHNLNKFDVNLGLFRWSRYDDGKIFYSGLTYHNLVHLPQLKILFELTKKEIFLQYYDKWRSYSRKYYFVTRFLDFPIRLLIKFRGLLGV